MRTHRLEALSAFYVAQVGMTVVKTDGARSVWLALAPRGAVLMIERAAPGEPSIPTGSMELVAFAVDAAEKARRRRALESAGVSIESETAHTIYFPDPDGRRVALSDYDLDGA